MANNAFIRKVAAAALASIDAVIAELGLAGGKRQGHEYLPLNPRRADSQPGSFSVNMESGAWSDFATGDRGGDLVSLAAYVWDMKQGEAAERLAALFGISPPSGKEAPAAGARGSSKALAPPAPGKRAGAVQNAAQGECVMPVPDDAPEPPRAHAKHGKPASRWAYLDASGRVNSYHDRYEPKGERKQFAPLTLWRLPGKLEWRFKAAPDPRPLFGLDMLAAQPDAHVCITEGEKARDAAGRLLPDHVVTCWAGGAQAVEKSEWSALAGRDVMLWPDADEPGGKCMSKLAGLLIAAGAKSVRLVNLVKLAAMPGENGALIDGPPLEKGDDAADLVDRGWNAAHLETLLALSDFLIEPAALGSESDMPADTVAAGTAAPRCRFEVNDKGVWFNDMGRDGEAVAPRWICARLDVVAMVRDPLNSAWGYLVEFQDHDRKPHREIIPARDFRGEGLEIGDRLLDRGLAMAPKARQLLLEYLQTSRVKKRARITNRGGWHGGVFVTPDASFGADSEEWIFQTESPAANTFKLKGTLPGWRDSVARLCRGNSRLLFSVSLSFAAPLLQPAGIESGGFHFRSSSSDGKTTALRVAASVCGGPDYMGRWRATSNAIEGLAMQHCDAPLLLDELAQLDPREAGETAYMLSNGAGKSRADRTGASRARATWRILFLSSGEIGLATHMTEIGKTTRAGQELRLADIPADAGAGLGVFENLHEHGDGNQFAKALDHATRQHYGGAFVAFLEKLTGNLESVPDTVHKAIKTFERNALSDDASGQARRVATRFALVGAAGEIATDWGITGWAPGEAMGAAMRCFSDWLAGRGGEGNQEARAMMNGVREFLRRYGESAFTDWDRPAADTDTHASVRSDRVGFRRHIKESDELEYFVFPSLFQSRVCKGYDHAAVGRLLLEKGYIRQGSEKDRPWLCKEKLPAEGRGRVVHILPAIWEDE